MEKNTLYVSDLDGTLFNRNKCISKYTADTINRCIDRGMQFTVATARMPYGCDYRLEDIRINAPGILTNGVFLYDFAAGKIIEAEIIDKKAAQEVLNIFQKYNLSCFVYTYDQGGISLCYGDKSLEAQTQYYSERALEKCRKVQLREELHSAAEKEQIVYMTYSGKQEILQSLCDELSIFKEVSYSFYLNIYNGLYCLEIYSKNASKRNALNKLKKLMNCDELVVFGDNLNDLSMIEIADRSYAPQNALDKVKEMATDVIDDCDHDGVAKFLAQEWYGKENC